MKFSKGDVVRQVLPSGIMVGGLMVVINNISDKCTAVRDVLTGKYYIYRSEHLGKEGKATKILVSKSDMNKIDTTKGVGAFYHSVSPVYDKLYANPSRFVCFILAYTRVRPYIEYINLEKYLEYYEKLMKFVKDTKWFQLSNQCTSFN